MSSANVSSGGTVRQLDRAAQPDEVVSEQDVTQPAKLAKLLARLLSDVAVLRRRWSPRRLTFLDQTVTSGGVIQLAHGFGGRVVWTVVDWVPTATGTSWIVERDTTTTESTLALKSSAAGVIGIRVEEAG